MPKPPDSVAGVLGTGGTEEVLLVERVSKINQIVVHRSETWFSSSITQAIDPRLAGSRPPALVLGELGCEFARFDQFVEAVLSCDKGQELIGMPVGTAVLQVVRTAYETADSALFQSLHRHPGASTRIDIDLPIIDTPAYEVDIVDVRS